MDSESNALLRAIIGASTSAFISIDRAQNIQLFSEGAEAMFGYTAKEVSGRPVTMLLPKHFRKSHKKHVTAFVRGSDASRLMDDRSELTGLRKDGSEFAVEATIIRFEEDGETKSAAILHDVTERKKTDAALQKSEEKFRQVFEDGPLGIALVGHDNTLLAVNDRYCQITGFSEEELLGRSFTGITHPDDIEWNLELAAKGVDGEIHSYQTKKRYIRKDGETVWVSITANMLRDAEGKPLHRISMVEDITAQKLAADELKASEERFRQIFERGSFGMSLVNLEGEILSSNEQLSEMLGYSRSELEGRRFTDLTHPDDVQMSMDLHLRLLNGEIPSYKLEKRYIRKDGETVWGNLTVSAMHGPDGKPQSSLAMIEDITERKLERDKLRESQERFQQVFERGPLGIAMVGPGTGFLAVNDRYCEITGYSEAELIGRKFTDITHPDDVEADKKTVEEGFKTKASGYDIEKRYIKKDGKTVWVNITATIIYNSEGEPAYAIAMVEDITGKKLAAEALQESEERFRKIFRDAPIGMAMINLDGGFQVVSKRFCKMLGYSEEELKERTFQEITHPDDLMVGQELMVAASRGEIPYFDVEKRYITKSGATLWARLTLSVIKNPEGEVQYNIAMVEDITEKKHAADALQESEARFRQTFDLGPLGMAMVGLENEFIELNDRYCEITGYSKDELMKKSFAEITHPDDVGWNLALAKKNLERGIDEFNIEKRYIRKDGEVVWVSITSSVVKDAHGEPLHTIAMVEDITEKKQAADALQESEERFRQTFERGPLGMALVTLDGVILSGNERLSEILGYSREELEGRRFNEVTHPDDIQMNIDLNARLFNGEIPSYRLEKRYISKKGDVVWGNVTVSAMIGPDGKPVTALAMVEDITGRKKEQDKLVESEEQFRRIFQDAPMGMAMANTDNRFLAVNEHFCKMLGYSEEELMRLTFGDITHPDDVEKSIKILAEAGESGSPFYEIDKRYLTKAGETIWAHLTSSLIRNPEGEVQFNIGMVEDITEKRLADKALRESEEQLRRAQKMEAVGQLTGGVAHEFNNLLMVVLGNIELLEEGLPKDDPMRKFAKTAMQSVQRGSELTQSLLAFSRKQSLKTDNVDVNGLVYGMRSLLQRSLGETILIETDLDESLWQVAADANQIEGALLNFLLNSRDAMPGGGTIIVRTKNRSIANPGLRGAEGNAPESDFVLLEVEDFGVGMSDEVIERAFEPFFTTKEVGKGTGLGLSVIYGFAKQSGGFLEIDSTPGQGTMIGLYLPRAVGPKDKAKGKKPNKPKKQSKAKRAKKVKNKGRPKTTGK